MSSATATLPGTSTPKCARPERAPNSSFATLHGTHIFMVSLRGSLGNSESLHLFFLFFFRWSSTMSRGPSRKNTFLPDRGLPVLTFPRKDSGHRVAVAPPAPLCRKRWGGAVSRDLQRPPSPPHAPPGKPGAHEGSPPAPRGACRDPQGSPEEVGTRAFHA